jgi:hypothetical protein
MLLIVLKKAKKSHCSYNIIKATAFTFLPSCKTSKIRLGGLAKRQKSRMNLSSQPPSA